jgi:hypothetical protein
MKKLGLLFVLLAGAGAGTAQAGSDGARHVVARR